MTGPRVVSLHIHPIKACAGISIGAMRFDALGPLDDRRWMLVDADGGFVTQREAPELALVRPARHDGGLRVLAPDMPALRVEGRGGMRREACVWDDRCAGFDEGDEAAAWFGDYLRRPVRLLRFDTTHPREASRHWVGDAAGRPGAATRFSDGYPLLVTSVASLAALDERLARQGLPRAAMQRFRPNVVIDGIEAFDEDRLAAIGPAAPGGPVLRLVKPCTRCMVVDVDPASGRRQPGVLKALAGFRSDPRLGGAPTFGWNAIVVDGLDGELRVGDRLPVMTLRA